METRISLLNKQLVWITLINGGYVHYTKNFLKSMERANIRFNLIVFCLDEEAFRELNTHSQCICLMADFAAIHVSRKLKKWGDIDYKKIVFAKLDAIAYTLKCTYKLGVTSVGYIDTDMFLFSDPTPIMLRELELHPDVDIVCQCDERSQRCSNRSKCGYICSGVFVIRNKQELYDLFTYTDAELHAHYSDQHLLQEKLNQLSIKYRTIEKDTMTNGGYFIDIYEGGLISSKVSIVPSMCLIHFNYMEGNEKESSMKLQGLWLLDSPAKNEYYTEYM